MHDDYEREIYPELHGGDIEYKDSLEDFERELKRILESPHRYPSRDFQIHRLKTEIKKKRLAAGLPTECAHCRHGRLGEQIA